MGKRMFSHVMVGARDLARLGAFYDAALAPLGLKRHWQGVDDGARCVSNEGVPRSRSVRPAAD